MKFPYMKNHSHRRNSKKISKIKFPYFYEIFWKRPIQGNMLVLYYREILP